MIGRRDRLKRISAALTDETIIGRLLIYFQIFDSKFDASNIRRLVETAIRHILPTMANVRGSESD